MPFRIEDWYWFVNGRRDRVYSSRAGDYVPADNAAYQAWLGAQPDHVPTEIANEAQLGEVLSQPRLRPTPAGILDAYLDKQADGVVDAVQFKILFNHENRMRALERAAGLNGSPPNLTANQAKAAVKVLL